MVEQTGDQATVASSGKSDLAGDQGRSGAATFVPQFALDAADARISAWSGAVIEAADAIDRLIAAETLPVPNSVRELATSSTQKLRDLGTKASEREAAELAAGLQRAAAAHPAASIGVGAAIGAALAALLVRVGTPAGSSAGQSGQGSRASKGAKG